VQELEPYGAGSSHNIGWSRSRKVLRLRQLQLRSYVQQKKHVSKLHHEFCGRIMFTRLRLRVKILMRLWRLRSRITFSPGFLMRLRNACFFLIVWRRSCISLRLRLQLKDAVALKGCGSGCPERVWLRLFNADLNNRHLQPLPVCYIGF
jgi:hypothetical protein